jgi:hypothetical protein
MRAINQKDCFVQAIAQQFGISRNQVTRIVCRQQWAEVE